MISHPHPQITNHEEQNFPDNVLYQADNLNILRGMNSETVDLIATDPPFNTGQTRTAAAGSYPDRWRWENPKSRNRPARNRPARNRPAWNKVKPEHLEQIQETNPTLAQVIQVASAGHSPSMAPFLCFLGLRLIEMHRILKSAGSIYLHCDRNASAYLRLALDAIFGAANFRNEITWKRATAHNDAGRYGAISDSILFYGKSRETTWNGESIATPKTPEQIARAYPQVDRAGRYQSSNLTGPLHNARGKDPSTLAWREYDVYALGRCWSVSKTGKYAGFIEERFIPGYTRIRKIHDRLDALDGAGLITHPQRGKWPGLKRYAEANRGNRPQDIILEPTGFTNFNKGKEYTGFPDQKPLALYEKFILASSNPGDLVMDRFAGSATTLVTAQKNGRRWVGIDLRPDTRIHLIKRMEEIQAKEN